MSLNSILNRLRKNSDAGLADGDGLLDDRMIQEKTSVFYDHWRTLLQHDSRMPHLRDYLDNTLPEIQPCVAIVDVFEEKNLNIRLVGTKRANQFGKDLTRANPLTAFSKDAQEIVTELAWQTVFHPCGSRGLQSVTTTRGRLVKGATMALPLQVDETKARCFVHYHCFMSDLEFDETAVKVVTVDHVEWVDIGAGVPS